MVFDVFGDSVDFVLGLVDFDLWIRAGDGIDFSTLFLLLEDGAFSDADCKLVESMVTLRSALEMCGDSNFSLNLLFSIMSSKSISTFFPLWRL